MSKGTTKRSVRVEDDLWLSAQQAAEERGHNLSDIIRDRLKSYTDGTAPADCVRSSLSQAWEDGRQAGWDNLQMEFSVDRNPYE